MKDIAEVSKEVVATSFSSSNFAKAIDCWQVLREQALLVSGGIVFCYAQGLAKQLEPPHSLRRMSYITNCTTIWRHM